MDICYNIDTIKAIAKERLVFMFVVFSCIFDSGVVCICYKEGGIGSAIAHSLSIAKLQEDTLLEVRCLGRQLSLDSARKVLDDFSPWEGRAIWKNGVVLDRTSDKKSRR